MTLCCIFATKRSNIVNKLWSISLSHKEININHLGKLLPTDASAPQILSKYLHKIKAEMEFEELYFLNTCNRILFLMVTPMSVDEKTVEDLYLHFHSTPVHHPLDFVVEKTRIRQGADAVEHLFNIASSVDSLVVGEREILGQVRQAYNFCNKEKLTGDTLRLLMQEAVVTAKEVYTRTKIGENAVSVVSLAVKKMLQLPLPQNPHIAIIGAGQTNTLMAKFLLKYGYDNFTIFNRSEENGKALAKKLGGTFYPLDALSTYDKKIDLLITCTGANAPIVTEPIYLQLTQQNKATFPIIDLAVPSDVAVQVLQKYEPTFIGMEEIRALADYNMTLRQKEVVAACAYIQAHLEEFKIKYRRRNVERAMAVIPQKIKAVKTRAYEQVFQKEIADLDEDAKETLDKVVAYLEKKYIGIPIVVAKEALMRELGDDLS